MSLRVLIGGEFRGTVRDAFIACGHDAVSCDFKPTEKPGPHYQGDWLDIIGDGWDVGIFHPTCTFMANSGAKHLYVDRDKVNGLNEERWVRMGHAAWDFWHLLNREDIPYRCLENPVMLGYAQIMVSQKASQIVQPWQFGHKKMRGTGLWLRNLPKLVPTDVVGPPPKDPEERKKWADVHRHPPTKDPEERRMARSIFYQGFADAMADQWPAFIEATRLTAREQRGHRAMTDATNKPPDHPTYFVLGRKPGDNTLCSPVELSFSMDISTERAMVFQTAKFYSILGEHDIDGLKWAQDQCRRSNRDHPGWDFRVFDAHADDFPISVDWETWHEDVKHGERRKYQTRNPAFQMKDDEGPALADALLSEREGGE